MWFEDAESSMPTEGNPLHIKPLLGVGLPVDDMIIKLTKAWSSGLRFKDINVDRGIYDIESTKGKIMNSEATEYLHSAGVLRKSGHDYQANDLYTKALQVGMQLKNNGEFLGETFAFRSMTFLTMNQYDESYSDALSALRCYPILREAHLQLIEILQAQERFEEAFHISTVAYSLFHFPKEYIKRAVKLSTKTAGGLKKLAKEDISEDLWGDVLHDLWDEGFWSSVRILLMGTDDLPALVTSFDASKVQLSGLLESCRETSLKEWGQKLALLLIRKGANHQTLCAKSRYPLHVALQLTLKTDTFELLKWLLANKAGTNISCTDENGNNLLHLACRSKTTAKGTAVKLLLNHKVDASAKNNDGKIPLDYLDKQDKDYDAVKKQMGINTDVAPSKDSLPARSLVSVTTTGSGLGSVVSTPGLLYPSQIILDFKHLKTWTKTRVQKWLESCNLGQHKNKFKDVDGPLLYEMKMMQNVAPEMFYKVLEESLQLPLVDLLKVSYSLRHIPQVS